MDYDLSRWLKDDLGLIQMSEIDLNRLMFHPRHGSLCRRLVKFLAESTLCDQKYPNVYAPEEYIDATNDLERTNENLHEVLKNLDLQAKEDENHERELIFLQSKLEHLRMMEELQQTTSDALKEMENRNNFGIDQMAQHIEKAEYLSDSSLEALYSVPDMNKVTSMIMTRQTNTIDEELNEIVAKVEAKHTKINESLRVIRDRIDTIDDSEPKLRKTSFQDLVALKVPEFGEITVELNADEKKLEDKNIELLEKVTLLDQQVVDLKDQYETKKNDLNRGYKDEIEKYLDILGEIKAIENVLLNSNKSC